MIGSLSLNLFLLICQFAETCSVLLVFLFVAKPCFARVLMVFGIFGLTLA